MPDKQLQSLLSFGELWNSYLIIYIIVLIACFSVFVGFFVDSFLFLNYNRYLLSTKPFMENLLLYYSNFSHAFCVVLFLNIFF